MANTAHFPVRAFPWDDDFALAALVEKGLPVQMFRGLSARLNLAPAVLAVMVGFAPRTAARRLSGQARLKPTETERTVRIARLLCKAEDVLAGHEEAATWFNRPLEAFNGKSPLEMCRTEPGARAVEQTLGRIEHGVFS
ncbi:MAG: antitoxin Xre/MbcA/ParS toxin-binding domain-containing protein, partial [Opitutaceae bacterium]|jgi:putative toxin-antitoxin system antitoxin component (TIGR02293 family)